jgi:two-component system heavy metal sensor histidine kinase CusS
MRATPSIALRLGMLFALIAAAVFVAVGAYLYRTLSHQMGGRDDVDLLNKAVLVRQVLRTLPAEEAMAGGMPAMLGRAFGQDGVVVQVSAPSTRDPSQLPPAREPRLADIVSREDANGAKRVLTVMVEGNGAPLQVTMVRMRSDRLSILRRYAFDLLGALAAGTLVATALGFLAVRRGLRPLHGVIGKANDINAHRLTTRMAVERVPRELRELVSAFNAMLDRLEEGVQRLSGFAADLAHDLRTPVNALMMQTQVALSRERSSEEYQALLASNLEEYERLSRMIENTLFLARADSAQLALRRDRLDVRAELERVRDYFEMLAEDQGISLRLDADPSLRLHADPVLLRRAVNNLVSNAVAYTPAGGAVSLSAREDGPWLALAVANSGEGIAPEHLGHVFERYYRADQARAGGTSAGLGLSIVRAIMQLHGGVAEVESNAGQETVFTLRFPLQVAA